MYNKDTNTTSQNSNTKHSTFNIYQLFPQRTEDECLAELKQYPELYWTYKNWPDDWKKRFMEFMEGKKSLPLTYDPFFKKIFNPEKISHIRICELFIQLLCMKRVQTNV